MVLLFVSCLFRGLGNFIVYIMNARFMNYALVTSVVRTAPSLVFITGYSVFIYFFGKLASYEEKSYNIARPILIFLNILSYAGYIFISLLYKENNTLDYIYTISGFYGIIYLIISILLLIFWGKVWMIIIEKKSLSLATANSKERKAFDSISKKLNYLTIFLVMMFFLRAAYNLMFSWGIVNTIFTLQYYWQTAESIFFFLTEFIPIIITVAVFYSGGSGAFMIDFDIEETHMWMKKMYNDDELDIS